MKINIGGQKPDAKETTTLAEKAKNFEFKKPTLTPTPAATSSQSLAGNGAGGNAESVSNKPNANNLLGKQTAKPQNETATQSNTPTRSIPAMSDDKYEVVADASDTFSKDAGDKFQQQLDILSAAIDGTGDLRDGMTNVLTFLDDNPEYKDNIAPQDIAIFVSACRKVAGITVTEKKTRVTKRKTTSALEADIMADLAGLDLEL